MGFFLTSGKLAAKCLRRPLLTLVSYGTRSWRGWPLWGIPILDLWSTFWQGIKCRKTDRSSCCKSHNISLRHVIANFSPSMATTSKDGASSWKARGCGCCTQSEEDWEGAPCCLWRSSYAVCIGYALFPSSKKKYYILAIEILFSMWNAFEFTQSSFYIVSWITPIE